MPSESEAQKHLMAGVAHGTKPKAGVPPVKVAKEFNKADQLAKAKALKSAATTPHGLAPMPSSDNNPERY